MGRPTKWERFEKGQDWLRGQVNEGLRTQVPSVQRTEKLTQGQKSLLFCIRAGTAARVRLPGRGRSRYGDKGKTASLKVPSKKRKVEGASDSKRFGHLNITTLRVTGEGKSEGKTQRKKLWQKKKDTNLEGPASCRAGFRREREGERTNN